MWIRVSLIIILMGSIGNIVIGSTRIGKNSLLSTSSLELINSYKESKKTIKFDGARAFEHVRNQVEFGPRPAGSIALKKTQKYLVKQLKSFGLNVTLDKFISSTPSSKFPKIEMTNIVAELPGKSDDVLIIASHYDTKYFENLKFLGANDGGSSTGVLLELAYILASVDLTERKISQTIWFTFFDGEEAIVDWMGDDHTYGSRHMVSSLQNSGKISKIKAMILLDMVGDKDLVIPKESLSTDWLADNFVIAARNLGYSTHFPDTPHYIEDDHIPFLTAGIPSVDLIDFSFGTTSFHYGSGGSHNAYWHTEEDTLDKISAKSLKIVGETVIKALPNISEKLR